MKVKTEQRSSGKLAGFFRTLGPGIITGASDDDPSGIGTYSQAGAQFGFGLGWTMLLTFPLMAAIQEISARIDRRLDRAWPEICVVIIRKAYSIPSRHFCLWPIPSMLAQT